MARRLDEDIRNLAQTMQERRNAASARVKAGEILHLNFMDRDELENRATLNLVSAMRNEGWHQLADAANYGLARLEKGWDIPNEGEE